MSYHLECNAAHIVRIGGGDDDTQCVGDLLVARVSARGVHGARAVVPYLQLPPNAIVYTPLAPRICAQWVYSCRPTLNAILRFVSVCARLWEAGRAGTSSMSTARAPYVRSTHKRSTSRPRQQIVHRMRATSRTAVCHSFRRSENEDEGEEAALLDYFVRLWVRPCTDERSCVRCTQASDLCTWTVSGLAHGRVGTRPYRLKYREVTVPMGE